MSDVYTRDQSLFTLLHIETSFSGLHMIFLKVLVFSFGGFWINSRDFLEKLCT